MSIPGALEFELHLEFRLDEREIISELVKWLVQEQVYDFDYSRRMVGDINDRLVLDIQCSWTSNLQELTDKITELYPCETWDDEVEKENA